MSANNSPHTKFYSTQQPMLQLDFGSDPWQFSVDGPDCNMSGSELGYSWPEQLGAIHDSVGQLDYFHYDGAVPSESCLGREIAVEHSQSQWSPGLNTPYFSDAHLGWDMSPSSTQSTTPQLTTPFNSFDYPQPEVYRSHFEELSIDMGPPDSFAPKTGTQRAFPSQEVVNDDRVAADAVVKIFAEAPVDSSHDIMQRYHEVIRKLEVFTSRQKPEIQKMLLESVTHKIGTEANCQAASKRKRKEAVRLYPCYWCFRTFTTKNNLGNHVRAHMQLKISKCHCGYESTNATIPMRHRRNCTKL